MISDQKLIRKKNKYTRTQHRCFNNLATVSEALQIYFETILRVLFTYYVTNMKKIIFREGKFFGKHNLPTERF